MPSVDTLFAEVLSGPDYLDLTRRGRGVKPSDLGDLACRLFNRDWRYATEGTVKRADLLPSHRVDEARTLVKQLVPEVVEGARLAHRVNRAVLEMAAEAGVTVTLSELSEPVLGRVGQLLCSPPARRPADLGAWVAATARAVLELRVAGDGKITPADFASRYAARVDALWAAEGTESLAADPPSRVGLGDDRRPPLLSAGQSAHGESWIVGSNRSFYGRVWLIWRGRTRARRRGSRATGHIPVVRRLTPPGADLAAIEIARACRPLGLQEAAHRDILRAGFDGAGRKRGANRGAWAAQRSACQQHIDTAALAAGVADLRDRWLGRPAAEALAALYGDLPAHLEIIQSAMVRKTWMDLLRYEREHEGPACSCLAGRYFRVAVARGVPMAFHAWLGVQRSVELTDDHAPHRDPLDDLLRDRRQATFTLLQHDMTMATPIVRMSLGWEELYQSVLDAEARHGVRIGAVYLTTAELRECLMAHQRRVLGSDDED